MSEVANLWVTLRAETAPFTRGLGDAAAKGESFTQRMGGVGGMMTKVGKATTVAGLGIAAVSIKMAGDFQASMQKLVTTAGESQSNLGKVSSGIKSIAVQTGTGTKELSDGMYMVESAGFHGASGLNVLKAAAEGARAEQAPLPEVTNAVTSALKSYHLPASAAVQITNQMIAAVGHGKMTFGEFAGSLSTVLPIAASAHLSFAQVGGAIATLTNHGTSAREATQELAFTIRSLQAPNNVAVQEMQRLGISSNDVSTKLGQRGLTGTIDMLQKAVLSHMGPAGTVLLNAFNTSKQAAADANTMISQMPKSIQALAESYSKGSISMGDWRKTLKGLPADQANLLSQYAGLINKSHGFNQQLKNGGPASETYNAAMKKIMGGATGLNTALMLGGENAKDFNKNVAAVGEAGKHAGKDVEGWAQTQKTFNVQMAQLKERVETTAITIGTKLIPVVTSVIGFFAQHQAATKALAVVIGAVLAGAVLKFVGGALSPLVKGIGGAIKGTANLARGFLSAEAAASDSTGKIGSFGGAIRTGVDAAVSGVKTAGSAVKDLASAWGSALATGGKMAWTSMVSGLKAVGTAMKTASLAALEFSKSMLTSAVSALRTAAAWVAEKVALVATTVAEKAAAVAQWALDAAMNASPITIVILALIALVAAVVYAYNHFSWFRTGVQAAWSGIVAAGKAAWAALKAVFDAIVGALASAVGHAVSAWHSIASAFSNGYHQAVAVGSLLLGWVKALPGRIVGLLAALGGWLASQASSAWNSFKNAAVNKALELVSWVRSIPRQITSALGNLGSLLFNAGASVISGLISGIKSALGGLGDALGSVTSFITSHKGPPEYDRVMLTPAGQMIMQGLMDGLNSRLPHLAATTAAVGQTVQDSFANNLGIASPSKVFRSLGIYLNEGLVDGITGSTARVKSATRRLESLLMETYNRVSDLRGTRGVSNRWVNAHEATLRHLESYVGREDRLLRSLAARRDAITPRIKAAQKALAAVQKQWNAEVKTVASGIMQGFSIITTAPQEGFAMSAADVVNHMQDQMAKATQFAAELQTLQRKGLSATLIQQLASAGVDQGGATAAALAGATKGQIAQLNKLQSATQSAANGVGAAVADSMYGAGLHSAQGLVKGLQSQQAAIERQMMKIAESMQKAIKKALGIRSPSRVFEEIATWIPKGLAKGVDGSAYHATDSVNRLAGAMAGAGVRGSAGLAMAGGSGGTTVVHQHYEFHIEGNVRTIDGLAKDVEAAFLRRGMRNSQTYPSYRR
ncbi:phage tail tape measure protein [Streptomyces sp. NPDC020192]|uniref:phage tail tape measure protein n=1 Tax=Streptomyces sp. NPDC020192 TaxID=3365066 RepID=UPI00379DD3D3